MDLVSPVLLIGSLALTAHALFSLYLLLYSWEYPERLEASRGPSTQREPKLGFTVLLPARHEEAVIAETIKRIWAARYPRGLLQIIVICHDEDIGTIKQVRRTIRQIGSRRVRLVTFSGMPINKPRALNIGLEQARHPVITVFDAEDDVDPDVFSIVNTVMLEEGAGVVQSGVQLMNFTDHWFSVHNCLEYFFWFKSRLHFHAKVGMIPLGGNTVFMRRDLLDRVNGWDATCLTEDADIGLRLSTLGEPIRVIYDPQHVTREETPSSVESLIRQRTRWNQGFMHVLRKGFWLELSSWKQRALAVYTFSYPFIQGPITLIWPLAILAGLFLKVPVPVAMASFLPLYAMLFQLVVMVVGVFMFAREYGLRVPWSMPLKVAVTFMPYQLVLGFSAARAVYRELQREGSWEKTEHVGAHRRPPVPVLGSLRPVTEWWVARVRPLLTGAGARTARWSAERVDVAGLRLRATREQLQAAVSALSLEIRRAFIRAERPLGEWALSSARRTGQWAREISRRGVSAAGEALPSEPVTSVMPSQPSAIAQSILASLHMPPPEAPAPVAAMAVPERFGTSAESACPGCGRLMSQAARFCRRCGMASRAPQPVALPLAVPASRPAAVRRTHRRAAAASVLLALALVASLPFLEIALGAGQPSRSRPLREGPPVLEVDIPLPFTAGQALQLMVIDR